MFITKLLIPDIPLIIILSSKLLTSAPLLCKPSTIAPNLSLSLYLSSPKPFIIIVPSAEEAAIDSIGYSSINAEEFLLSIVIFFNFEDFTIILQVFFPSLIIFIKAPIFFKILNISSLNLS